MATLLVHRGTSIICMRISLTKTRRSRETRWRNGALYNLTRHALEGVPFLLIRLSGSLLPSGTVILFGGTDYVASTSSCEAYLLLSDQWLVPPGLSIPRHEHTATLFSSGQVSVTGGQTTSFNIYSSCELYDSALNTWRAVPDMSSKRSRHTAVLLKSEKVFDDR